MDFIIAQQLFISLGLGMLIGLQRERRDTSIAGIRTFPLITVLGTISGQLALHHGGWIIAAGLASLGALLFVANLPSTREGGVGGLTTEVAVLLLFALGAYLTIGPTWIVVLTGGVAALLLHGKPALHRFAHTVGDREMHAIMLFVLLSMVILPVVPNEAYGPYDFFNPFEVWLMVVLIVGISLGGYVAYRLFGGRAGGILAGVLGGVISSTATAVSAARQSKDTAAGTGVFSLLIMVASTVAVLRVLVEIAVVASRSFPALAPPLAAFLGAMVLIAAGAYFFTRRETGAPTTQENPAQLRAALIFAAIYALIKLAVAVAKDYFGTGGLYLVAVISGMTDVDAITLSTSRLVAAGQLEAAFGWRMILIAALANLVFKGAAVAVLGSRALAGRVAALFGLSGVAGGLIIWLWP